MVIKHMSDCTPLLHTHTHTHTQERKSEAAINTPMSPGMEGEGHLTRDDDVTMVKIQLNTTEDYTHHTHTPTHTVTVTLERGVRQL